MTINAKGNIVSGGTLAASGTSTNQLDFSAKFEGQVQVEVAFGTVAATSGVQITVFRRFGAGPTDDTISILTFTIPSTASTTKDQSFALPTGKYDLTLTNLDATNSVTGVNVTTSTVDSIA
jgi:hypothetical protein